MELVEGKTLDARIPDGGMELHDFLALAVPLAEGLGAAHGAAAYESALKQQGLSLDDVKLELKKELGIQRLVDRDFAPQCSCKARWRPRAGSRVLAPDFDAVASARRKKGHK